MAYEIHLRLYEELNDFLPINRRKQRFALRLDRAATVQDLLETLGVPAACVEFVLVNGDSVDFWHHLKDGDFVSVFPVFESLDVKPLMRLRKEPLRRVRFMTGEKLVRLRFYLRFLGFDTLDCSRWPQDEIARVADEERRILLIPESEPMISADCPSRVCVVRETRPLRQLKEVLSRLDLYRAPHFTRLQSIAARALSVGIQPE